MPFSSSIMTDYVFFINNSKPTRYILARLILYLKVQQILQAVISLKKVLNNKSFSQIPILRGLVLVKKLVLVITAIPIYIDFYLVFVALCMLAYVTDITFTCNVLLRY